MKKFPWIDMSFIFLSTIVLLTINHFLGADTLSKYALIVALAGYYIGKYVGKKEVLKEIKNQKTSS